jgi:transcriptional regulator with XRE-family HTH domain
MMPRRTSLGQKLLALRQEQGLTLRQLAAKAHISSGYLSVLERDKAPTPPSEKLVFTLAKALQTDGDELMASSGRIAEDVQKIILRNPREITMLLFAVRGMGAEQIEQEANRISKRTRSIRRI